MGGNQVGIGYNYIGLFCDTHKWTSLYRGGQHNASALTDKESVNCMKGVAALLIVFSHAHYYNETLGLLKIFKPFGYIGVSLFFFCSGYGVMKNYIVKEHYLDGFLIKKLKGVYIPYIVATGLWFITDTIFIGKKFDRFAVVISMAKSILLIKTALPFAWYVLAVLVWYFVFFLVAKIIKIPNKMLECLFILNIMWFFIGVLTGIPSFYYNGTCCLMIGCVAATIDKMIKEPGRLALLSSAVGLCGSILALHYLGGKSPLLYTVVVASSSAAFVLFIYIVGYRITFVSNITKYIGKYSYEIYLTQGIAYYISKELSAKLNGKFWIIFWLMMGLLICIERKIKKILNRLTG